jgi:hypothetical protein
MILTPRKTLSFWSLLTALSLVVSCSYAEDAEPKAEETPGLKIPIPIGQASHGLTIQELDEFGEEVSLITAVEAVRVNESRVEFVNLTLTLTRPDEPKIVISMPEGYYDTEKFLLISDKNVTIARTDFKIWGEGLIYNTQTGEGRLRGNTRMIINEKSEFLSGDSEKKPSPLLSDL